MGSGDAGQARLALLQLCDSLFPLGAFGHSDGLEAAVAAGQLSSAADLPAWMNAVLEVSMRQTDCPAVRDAMSLATTSDIRALERLDEELHAMRPSAAGRAASRTMGTRLLKTWQEIRPSPIVATVLEHRQGFTLPVAFGIVCTASRTDVTDALEAYCYSRLAATISAAMRLMPVGQHAAQRLLTESLARVPEIVREVLRSQLPPHSFAPAMDVAAMSHQYVRSRLFRS
jgi:urease accessory protein